MKAEEDLQKAHSLAGNGKQSHLYQLRTIDFLFSLDKNIKQQLDLVKSRLKIYEQEEKKIYTNMFSK